MRSSWVLGLLLLLPAVARGQETRQPVVDANSPDPGVLKVGGTYYMVATGEGFGAAFPIRTSTDLQTWTPAGFLFPPLKEPAWTHGSYWAPEIHAVAGHYVAYYTARNANGLLCIGAATAPSPLGPYTDLGQPLEEDPSVGSIDPTILEDTDGQLYLYWKSDGNAFNPPRKTVIYAQPLSSDGLHLTGTRTALIENDQPWEGNVVEAPEIEKHDGVYYLFYSGNCYDNDTYGVGVARSTSPLGPFVKHDGPILSSGSEYVGPGHISLTTSPSGEDTIVYHAWRRGQVGDPNPRVDLVDTVNWVNGWPTVNDGTTDRPAPAPTPAPAPVTDPGLPLPPPPVKTTAKPAPVKAGHGWFETLVDRVADAVEDVFDRDRKGPPPPATPGITGALSGTSAP
jgi:beta-xylosidase